MITNNLEIIGIKYFKQNQYYQLIWHNGKDTNHCFIKKPEADDLLAANEHEETLNNESTIHYSFIKK